MATVNTASLRSEFDALKARFEAAFMAVRTRSQAILIQATRELHRTPARIAKSDAENLHEELTQYETEVLRTAATPTPRSPTPAPSAISAWPTRATIR